MIDSDLDWCSCFWSSVTLRLHQKCVWMLMIESEWIGESATEHGPLLGVFWIFLPHSLSGFLKSPVVTEVSAVLGGCNAALLLTLL